MATISTAVELQDNFSRIMLGIVNSIDACINAVEQMHKRIDAPMSTASLDSLGSAVANVRAVMEKPIDVNSMEEASRAVEDAVNRIEAPKELAPVTVKPIQVENVPDINVPAVQVPIEPPKDIPAVEVPVNVQDVPKVEVPIDVQDVPKVEIPAEVQDIEVPKVEIPAEVQDIEVPAVNIPATVEDIQVPEVNPPTLEIPAEVQEITPPKLEIPVEVQEIETPAIPEVKVQADATSLNDVTAAAAEASTTLQNMQGVAGQQIPTTGFDDARRALDNFRAELQAPLDTSAMQGAKNAAEATRQAVQGSINTGNIDNATKSYDEMHRSAEAPISTSAVDGLKAAIQELTNTLRGVHKPADISHEIDHNTEEQNKFNKSLKEGQSAAESLKDTITGFAKAYLGMQGLNMVAGFAGEAQQLFDVQRNAENQLMGVLVNMVGETDKIQNAFDRITAKASEIQGRGIYGDEAMISAGAELSTYFTDTGAVEKMMDTLSNYAMGMSGGKELDSTAMTQYATALGKMMTGAYDAMTKKGFEVTDTQKAIIEGTATEAQIVETLGKEYLGASKDMQAAAAISQIVNESWGGLYETMSDTPRGKIIQMNNAIGDMKELIGKELYPYTLLFVDIFNSGGETIEAVVNGIVTCIKYLLAGLAGVMKIASAVASVIVKGWPVLAPIVYAATAALVAYYTALGISNGIMLINSARASLVAMWKAKDVFLSYAAAAAHGTLTSAMVAETAAQWGLNAALLACPLTWVVGAVIAVIAVLGLMVGAYNMLTDSSVSTVGIIVGLFRGLGASIYNVFAFVANIVLAVANFFGSVFVDPLQAAKNFFITVWNSIVDFIGNAVKAIIGLISKIPGVSKAIDLDFDLDSLKGSTKEIEGAYTFKPVESMDITEQARAGYSWGSSLSIDNLVDPVKDVTAPKGLTKEMTETAQNTGDTAKSAKKVADALDIMDEDLKFMRDAAEQEVVNKYTTAAVNIKLDNTQNINNGVDADGVVTSLVEQLQDLMQSGGEAVHV